MLPLIRCLAVDDEEYALTLLADYIQQVPFLKLVKTTTNPLEALRFCQTDQVDVLFLDIQMPELTGLQLLRLCGSRCKVILTTAYSEYALDGYENDVIDYLLKPISFERFLRSVQKVLPFFISAEATHAPPSLVVPSTLVAGPTYLFLKGDTKNKYVRVNHADIHFIEGLKNYVSVQLTTDRLISYCSLKDLSSQLPCPPFIRIHRSYIVALDKIESIDGHLIYIRNKRLPVGETYRDEVLQIIRTRQPHTG